MAFQTSDSGVVNLLWQNWRGGTIGLEQVSTKYLLDVLRQYLCCFCHVLHRQILEAINSLFVTTVKSVTLSIGCSDVICQHTFCEIFKSSSFCSMAAFSETICALSLLFTFASASARANTFEMNRKCAPLFRCSKLRVPISLVV